MWRSSTVACFLSLNLLQTMLDLFWISRISPDQLTRLADARISQTDHRTHGSAKRISGHTDQGIRQAYGPGFLPTFSNILGAQCGLRSHFQPRPAAPQLQPQQLQPPRHPPLLPWCVGEGTFLEMTHETNHKSFNATQFWRGSNSADVW